MIDVPGLDYPYDGHLAVRNVNLTVRPGTMTAVIGANGSRKSNDRLLALRRGESVCAGTPAEVLGENVLCNVYGDSNVRIQRTGEQTPVWVRFDGAGHCRATMRAPLKPEESLDLEFVL